MYKRILVAVEGSDTSHMALEVACILAERTSAKLILLCVTDKDVPEELVNAAINEGIVRPSDYVTFASTLNYPEMSSVHTRAARNAVLARTATIIAEEIIKDETGFAKDQNIKEIKTLVRSGDVAKAIVQGARDENADLVVTGSHNREGLDALMHPSVAEAVRKDAPCPVMVLFQSR